eukprot:146746-Chlamydomonas_euryale.AAC.1
MVQDVDEVWAPSNLGKEGAAGEIGTWRGGGCIVEKRRRGEGLHGLCRTPVYGYATAAPHLVARSLASTQAAPLIKHFCALATPHPHSISLPPISPPRDR